MSTHQPTITLTGTQLAAMHDARQGVYSTTDNEVYIAARPRHGRDACTRTLYTMLQEIGKDIDTLRGDETEYTFAVDLVPIRVEAESEPEAVAEDADGE
jgi:hypothetical protein